MSILSSESDFLHENINNVYYSLKANFYNTIVFFFQVIINWAFMTKIIWHLSLVKVSQVCLKDLLCSNKHEKEKTYPFFTLAKSNAICL